jgi:uncharacterized NAD(P)/FAD-binding protein YdhS
LVGEREQPLGAGSGVANRNAWLRGVCSRGPLTRAASWEIVAIPDIRNQCAELALRLANMCGTAPKGSHLLPKDRQTAVA